MLSMYDDHDALFSGYLGRSKGCIMSSTLAVISVRSPHEDSSGGQPRLRECQYLRMLVRWTVTNEVSKNSPGPILACKPLSTIPPLVSVKNSRLPLHLSFSCLRPCLRHRRMPFGQGNRSLCRTMQLRPDHVVQHDNVGTGSNGFIRLFQ